ncbi:uncharacterized protein LOC103991093 isoform X2 [Musa acuminata AAA Group]|uniref:uncharacterized protein LOC103991093 isoform X2 n=1 Tax=Musa acuminata AAA Group TaxID=214697 RepID=UPI0031D397AB
MESLCSSAVTPWRIEAPVVRLPKCSSLVKASTFRFWCGNCPEKLASLALSGPPRSPQSRGERWRVLAHGASGIGGENSGALTNGFSVLIDGDPASIQNDIIQNGGHEDCMSGNMEMVTPVTAGRVTTGSKAGLFRTPISGGVQSALAVNNLPHPALAVHNLMQQAKYGQLCTIVSRMHNRREGYPFGSLVDFAPDPTGHPIFSLSPLAIHTRNLLVNSKCSLVVQIPGWTSLSNARATIFGDVFPLAADQQVFHHLRMLKQYHPIFILNFAFGAQLLSGIYFIGGFGTVAWVDVKEYEASKPDKIAADSGEQNLKELNALFSKSLKDSLSTEAEIDDAAFISIDSKGTHIRVRQGAQFNVQRISFEVEHDVQTLDDAKAALEKIINRYNRSKSQTGS